MQHSHLVLLVVTTAHQHTRSSTLTLLQMFGELSKPTFVITSKLMNFCCVLYHFSINNNKCSISNNEFFVIVTTWFVFLFLYNVQHYQNLLRKIEFEK